MVNNKEEADRAREAAMNKFLAKDLAGASKFALKAQSLNPEMDGITQMVATFDMHLAAQHMINGVRDYYRILGVKPEADDETVKKHYKKLAVLLHPDKNKTIGGGEAFQFVSQAWSALSDKAERADYDKKRNFVASSTEHANSGVQESAKRKTPKRAGDGTFWTVCSTCRTQFEYSRVYLNKNLVCRHCRKPFIAVETDPPHPNAIRETFLEHQVDSVHTGTKTAAQAGPQKDEAERRETTKRQADATPLTNPPKTRKVVENAVAGSSSAPKSNRLSEEELTNVVVMKKSKPRIGTSLEDLIAIVPDSDFCDFNKNRTEKS